MIQEFNSFHTVDQNGNPTGGSAISTGIAVSFQNGPLQQGETPNGAFVETLLAIALDRLKFYQTAAEGKFNCLENAEAIYNIEQALQALNERTAKRKARGVEGTHTP